MNLSDKDIDELRDLFHEGRVGNYLAEVLTIDQLEMFIRRKKEEANEREEMK